MTKEQWTQAQKNTVANARRMGKSNMAFDKMQRDLGMLRTEINDTDKEKLNDWIKGQLGFGS